MAKKAHLRKITRKQALSYKRYAPNPIGVTAIAAVNGRGALKRSRSKPERIEAAKKAARTRKRLAGEHTRRGAAARRATRMIRSLAHEAKTVTPNKRRKGPPASVKKAMKACGATMKKAWAAVKKTKAKKGKRVKRNPTPNRSYASRYAATRAYLRNADPVANRSKTKMAKKKGKKKATKKGAAFKRTKQYKAMQAGLRKYRAGKGKKGAKKSPAKKRKGGAKKRKGSKRSAKGHMFGKFRALSIPMGKKRVRSYMYAKKGGGASKIPMYAIHGFKSAAAYKKAQQSGGGPAWERIQRRGAAIERMRKHAAASILVHGDAFTPNTSIPYSQWSSSMKANAKKKGKKKGSRKASSKKSGLTKKQRRSLAAKKAARTRKKNAAAKKRGRKGYKKNGVGALTANRRRGHHRSRRTGRFTRNAFMAQIKEGLKMGAVVVGGFLVHKVLTKVVSENVLASVLPASVAPYGNLISGAIVAAVAIPLAAKFVPSKALTIGAGIAASFLHSLILTGLNKFNQPTIAGYFANYPDAAGRAYHGYGEYLPMSGYGAYELNGFGAPLMQAAAGYGSPLMQAAAGMGAPLMQAAAGADLGEYMATGIQGIGEYEAVSGYGSGLGASRYMDDGIRPNLSAAEHALTVSEAAAGVGSFGDIPTASQWMPEMQTQDVSDVPDGMRAGIMAGGDGIFG